MCCVSSALPWATELEDKGGLVLRVTYSNWTEALLDALAPRLPRDPFVEATVVVPNRAMERVVELGLARRVGLVANVRFARLEDWLGAALRGEDAGERETERVLGVRALVGRLLAILSDPALEATLADEGPLAPVARYLLAGDGRWSSAATDRRRLELAPRLAQLFQEYAYSRPDWLRAWGADGPVAETGPDARVARWQSALYRRVRALAPGTTLAERVHRAKPLAPSGAEPVFVFGVSYFARVVHEALARVAQARDVELFVLNPCREFWSDVASRAGGSRRAAAEDASSESRLLEAWGRAGREHVAALDEATAFDTEGRFVEVSEDTTLGRVQRSILERRAVTPPTSGRGQDGSLVVLACPSVRREVETVVSLVWGALAASERRARDGEGEPLRLNEIAILVPPRDRDRYLPHLEVVLEGAREDDGGAGGTTLPWSAQDLRLVERSRVAEAGLRLVSFFGATPTRREVLGLVSHPLIRATAEELEAPSERAWAELAEEVGIVRGIDERDLRGTYADAASGEGKALHFDQGLSRLALGVAIDTGGGEPAAPIEGLAPAEIGGQRDQALAFDTLVRSLLADHRAISGARATLATWGALLDGVLAAYVRVSGAVEEAELERCRAAMRGLADLDVTTEGPGTTYASEVALGLARQALEDVPAVRGEPQAMGVVVASLLPMRAIPFRAVFVLGLGEGEFPETSTDLGLDLRRAERRAGDVTPEERDRYAFLETLLSTRERLVLSYVARDEHTGDPHAPSSVIVDLDEAVGGLLTLRPPPRRHEALDLAWAEPLDWLAGERAGEARAAMTSALGGAVAEREARARGDAERALFQGIEIASEAWARLPATDPRRVALALPALPDAVLERDRSVGLETLRAFLRCPIQGRARHWLREVEDEAALLVDEEPLDTDGALLERLARQAFVAALDRGLGAEPAVVIARAAREAVASARGRGRVPVGLLGEELTAEVTTRATRWHHALAEARPGAGVARAVRFGRVVSGRARGARRHEVRPALVLGRVAVPPGASASLREAAQAEAVTLEGPSRLFLRSGDGAPAGDLLSLVPGATGEGERGRVARGVAVLEAYVDHAVLAASGQDRLARRVVLLTQAGAYETSLPGLAREQAARWLRTLADEIRAPSEPAWFLPAEAVVLEAESLRRGDPKLADKLAKAVERVRTKLQGGSSRRGPLRAADVITRDAPEPRELVPLVARRHAPVLAAVRPAVRVAQPQAEGLVR